MQRLEVQDEIKGCGEWKRSSSSRIVPGKTCRQTVTAAYSAWKAGDTAKPGKLFWQQLRADYSDVEGIAARSLVVKDPLPQPAFDLFKGMIKSHPERAPFRTWMTGLSTCTESEAVIMAKAFLSLNPA
eukprot:757455-Amphidinium_carterae.3